MPSTEPFALFDCSLARCATGKSCTNLRELLDFVVHGSDAALAHHMMHCALDDHFELYEFPNDLARWCRDALGDDVLAEQLALIDPYQMPSMAAVRAELTNVIEERLWGVDRAAAWSRPGRELYIIESRIVSYDTGERYPTPASLAEALQSLSRRSLFLHVHAAFRRTGRTDDISAWLEQYGADRALVARLRGIDFYFLNIDQLRTEMIDAFHHHLTAAVPTR